MIRTHTGFISAGLAITLTLGACTTGTTMAPATPLAGSPSGGVAPTSSAEPSSASPTADLSPLPATPTPEPSPPPEPDLDAVSGRELVEGALEDGRIDHPTSLLYRVYALFDDPRLPAEYRGEVIDEDNEVFMELELGDVALSQAIQGALRPYLVRPDHPESVFSSDSAVGVTAGLASLHDPRGRTAALACIDRGQGGALTTWASTRAQAPVRVWAGCDGQHEADIATLRGVVDQVWAPMTSLMGPAVPDFGGPDEGGDDAIDIYLVDWCVVRDGECLPSLAGVLGTARTAPPYTGDPGTSSGFIWLPRTLLRDPAELRRTVVHEIFHALQFAHQAYAGFHPDLRWLYEGSAKWSETHFIEEAARAHSFYERFYQKLDLPLDAHEPTKRPYATYIWFLFAEQETGGAVVDRLFEAIRPTTDATQAMQALERTFSFRDRFRDFAVRNVNDRAILDGLGERTFQSEAGFPTSRPPLQNTVVELPADSGGPLRQPVDLHHLSADYWRFTLPRGAEGVAQTEELILDFEGIEHHGELDIDLLVRLPGGWERQQPDGGEVRFCRDVAAEDLEELWVVLSDHDIERRIAGAFSVKTRSKPCAGTADVTLTYDATSHLHEAHWTVRGDLERYREGMPLGPDQPVDDFVGTGTFDGRAVDGFTMSMTYIRPPRCERDQLWVEDQGEVYLTGTVIEEGWPGIDGPALLVAVFPVGEDDTLVFGLGAAAPLEGGHVEYEYLRAAVAECGEEWSDTTTITLAPGVAPP